MTKSIVGESHGVSRVMAAVAALLKVKQVLFKNNGRSEESKAFFIDNGYNVWRRYVNSGISVSVSWCADHGINNSTMQQERRSLVWKEKAELKP